jgi:uncharacterized protein YggT (Ycf19 family)
MAEVQQVEPVQPVAGDTRVAQSPSGRVMAKRVIWFITDVILILLAFRFVLALLGANPSNGFANFIYEVSHPFVAPFFSLFSYNQRFGVSRFETYTLVAMLVYLVIAWGLTKLLDIGRPTTKTVAQ